MGECKHKEVEYTHHPSKRTMDKCKHCHEEREAYTNGEGFSYKDQVTYDYSAEGDAFYYNIVPSTCFGEYIRVIK